MRARITHGLEGSLAVPAHLTGGGTWSLVEAREVDQTFVEGLLDLRRYARVGPESDVALRFVLAGALNRAGLPPQHQYALGGLPTLPGYTLFSQDCGARAEPVLVEHEDDGVVYAQRAFPYYGCDRVALLQLEYRRRLSLDLDWGPWEDDRWEWYPRMDLSPALGFFFDVGRGWSGTDPDLATELMSDVGLAFFLGKLGIYAAYPLGGEDKEPRLFLRFQRRF